MKAFHQMLSQKVEPQSAENPVNPPSDDFDDIYSQLMDTEFIENRMRNAQAKRSQSVDSSTANTNFQEQLAQSMDTMDDLDMEAELQTKPWTTRPYSMLSTSQKIALERALLDEGRRNLEAVIAPNDPEYQVELKKETARLFDEWEELCVLNKKVELP